MIIIKNILINIFKSKCSKCPYKLGLVKFIENPCPQCKINNYYMYDILIKKK